MVLWGVNDHPFAVSFQTAGSCFLREWIQSVCVRVCGWELWHLCSICLSSPSPLTLRSGPKKGSTHQSPSLCHCRTAKTRTTASSSQWFWRPHRWDWRRVVSTRLVFREKSLFSLNEPLFYVRTREPSSWFWTGRPSRSWEEPACLSTCLTASMVFTRPFRSSASLKSYLGNPVNSSRLLIYSRRYWVDVGRIILLLMPCLPQLPSQLYYLLIKMINVIIFNIFWMYFSILYCFL